MEEEQIRDILKIPNNRQQNLINKIQKICDIQKEETFEFVFNYFVEFVESGKVIDKETMKILFDFKGTIRDKISNKKYNSNCLKCGKKYITFEPNRFNDCGCIVFEDK